MFICHPQLLNPHRHIHRETSVAYYGVVPIVWVPVLVQVHSIEVDDANIACSRICTDCHLVNDTCCCERVIIVSVLYQVLVAWECIKLCVKKKSGGRGLVIVL